MKQKLSKRYGYTEQAFAKPMNCDQKPEPAEQTFSAAIAFILKDR